MAGDRFDRSGVEGSRQHSDVAPRAARIRTHVVADRCGRLGTICICEATDEAALREHARRIGNPGDEIEVLTDTVVVRPDPEKTGVKRGGAPKTRTGSHSQLPADFAGQTDKPRKRS